MSYLVPNEVSQGMQKSFKTSVRVASIANVNLAATHTALDGITLADEDRVLLKLQGTGSENGIYSWSSGTQLFTRARDGYTLRSGMIVSVQEGTQGE